MADVVYAFGDPHGCLGLLNRLDNRLTVLSKHIPANDPLVIGIGDYNDRGPDTKGVYEKIMTESLGGMPLKCNPGNHDVYMVRAIKMFRNNTPGWENWLTYKEDALSTIKSYGIPVNSDMPPQGADARRVMKSFSDKIGDATIDFIVGLPPIQFEGGVFFVHAGLNPSRAVNSQEFEDCIGGVKGFFTTHRNYGGPVCVGHTVQQTPYINKTRDVICIDTGAYEYGVLTTGIFSDGVLAQFIATCPEKGLDWVPVFIDDETMPDFYLSLTRMWFRDVAAASKHPPIGVFSKNERYERFLKLTRIPNMVRVNTLPEAKKIQQRGIKYRTMSIGTKGLQ